MLLEQVRPINKAKHQWQALLLFICLVLSAIAGRAHAQHAPIIFYNVPNWYSSGWDQIRYPTPLAAYMSRWESEVPKCANGQDQWVWAGVQMVHSDGYEDGDLYEALYYLHDYSSCAL